MLNKKMSSRRCIAIVLILVACFAREALAADQYGTNSSDEGVEVLTRGPIHEAFAEVSVDEAKPETVVTRDVPEPINEIPPEYKPEGDNVQWIPGYWAWDDDQNDFIWVSGVWRDLPPGRQWVPGYWTSVPGGNQYVSGYWSEPAQPEQKQVYLPPPPEPPATAPAVPAPSADNVWVGGHWLWTGNGYAWQAGYWVRQQPEMAWIPAHYVWTPSGYLFVPGYWDYQLARRGVMFAPRYYSRPIYRSHSYYYTPSIVLDVDGIFLSLFVRQHHRHYYFGDYHDVHYVRRGYIPWYSEHATRHGYDPYYRSYRWYRSRHDREWEHNYRRQFEYRRDHREARPPVHYRPHDDHHFAGSRDERRYALGRPLTEVTRKNDHNIRFVRTRDDERRDYRQHGGSVKPLRPGQKPEKVMPETKDRQWANTQKNMNVERDRPAVSPNVHKGKQDNRVGQKPDKAMPETKDRQWANTQKNMNVERDRPVTSQNDHKGKQENRLERQPQNYNAERQPQRGYVTQQDKPAPHKTRQPVDAQVRNQSTPQKTGHATKDLTQFPQQQKVPVKNNNPSGFSTSGNHAKRIDPKNESRTVHQPQKMEERYQPATSKRQKDIERSAKPQKVMAVQGSEQQNRPAQVKTKGKGSANADGQVVEGQGDYILVNGKMVKRPPIGGNQQRGRSDQK